MSFLHLATKDDEDFIRELSAKVFSIYGNYSEILPKLFLYPNVITIIAAEKAYSLGFAILDLIEKKDFDVLTGELLAIAVTPKHHRKGIGKALLNHIEFLAYQYNLKRLLLHTAENNIAAQSLFKKAGFEVVGFRENYYPNGQQATVMFKPLT